MIRRDPFFELRLEVALDVAGHVGRAPCSFSFHSPAGTAYTPLWMNMPKRASVNHFMRAAFCHGVSVVVAGSRVTERRFMTASPFFVSGLAVKETLPPGNRTAMGAVHW